ncbi:MAG TPA: acyl carrier protein [Kofleriaceae bacterium]|jgi:acyl carrier protein
MRDRLRSIIATELEVPPDSVPADASAETFQPWDSLGHMRIIIAIEEQLDVRFATAEIAGLTSIDKLVAALASRDPT